MAATNGAITTDSERKAITEALEELVETDLQEFKRHLWARVTSETSPISRENLEKSDCKNVADCMIQHYSDDAGMIAVLVLRTIKQNDLAYRLELKLKEVSEEEPLVPSSASPHTMTPCSQHFKTELLTKETEDVYIPEDKSQRKRIALLITNIQFVHLKNRDGAERDEENMEWLLTALGYSVEKHTNLSGTEIDTAIRNFAARSEHQDSDSTFVVLMSHGKETKYDYEDIILGVNYHCEQNPEDYFRLRDIYSHLNSENCPALINKPKVFLIQSCRGSKTHTQTSRFSQCFSTTVTSRIFNWKIHTGGYYFGNGWLMGPPRNCSGRWVHVSKDFVCFMSSPPGIISYRRSRNGSFFVNYIVEVFCERAHVDDIMELFRKVSSRMENETNLPTHCKILPCIEKVTLTKKFYLFPGL